MERDIARILITERQLAERVRGLASEIAASYPNLEEGLTLVTVLCGSIIFLADLIRHLPMKMKIGLITVSSYSGATTQSRGAKLVGELELAVSGRHVLVVDDILDTGRTLRLVQGRLASREPGASRPRSCFASQPKRPTTWLLTSSASTSRTSSWWAMAWTSTTITAISRTSPCSSRSCTSGGVSR
jgi:hypoxanthine phosphoribosyltransferase